MEKANWDELHTRYFCEICKEECDNHNRPLGCLSLKGYKNLERKFFSRTGKKLTRKQFKNKWDLLKKEYTQFMELKNAAPGLGWNDELGTIEADDDWWKTHLEKYPKHAKYKNKGLANLIEMDTMFDKAHVTGDTSSIPGEISDSTDDDGLLDVTPSKENDDASMSSLKKDKGKGPKKEVKRKAKLMDMSEKEANNPFLREYKYTLGLINSEVSSTRAGSNDAPTTGVPTMQEVLKLMKECGAAEGTPLFNSATEIVLKPEYRELFMCIETQKGRLDWLQFQHEKINK